jgi:hypothetical protein
MESASNGNGVSSRPLHVVAIPLPLQGHITPMFHFAKKLAAKGVIVTFVITETCSANLIKACNGESPFSHARSLGLDIRSVQVSDGFPLEFDRLLNAEEFIIAFHTTMIPHLEELIAHLKEKGPPISCIIADTFFHLLNPVAKKFGISYASFWTQTAIAFSIYYHLDLLVKNGHCPFLNHDDEHKNLINYIPGVSSLKLTDLPSYLQELDVSTGIPRIIYESFQSVRGADWIISNTVDELESRTIAELRSTKPVWSVGPLLPSAFLDEKGLNNETLRTNLYPESDCTRWLDSKPKFSILYISFGSFAHVSIAQIEEVAMGLLQSKQPFIWALRPDIVASGVQNLLPAGFLEEIKEQGLVVQWASQLEVLSHPSVGGFLTHCGWNSILESLSLGVPMLAFPLIADQCTNRKLIVEDWGAAMDLGGSSRINQNCGPELVGREEIARTVNKFMDEEEGRKLRLKVEPIRAVLKKVVTDGGTSNKNLDLFVEALRTRNDS